MAINHQGFPVLSAAAGVAAGVFLGLLIGLSRSPIIGAAITALVPLVGFFSSGISRGKDQTPVVSFQDTLSFILAFFCAASVGLAVGLCLRTSSTPIIALKGDLLAAGFSEQAAKEIISESVKKGTLVAANTTALGLYSNRSPDISVSQLPTPAAANCKNPDFGRPPYSIESISAMRSSEIPAWRDAGEILETVSQNMKIDLPSTNALHTKVRRLVCGD